jgi:BirA family transcriptional regulator, biotin operon repressor / biotin---[acetyl-CoA-carboxylase] ligase
VIAPVDEAAVQPLLEGLFGRPYRYVAETESTQDLIEDDDPHGTVASADVQAKGRGRLGRSWEAPAGTALLFSVMLRPPAGRRLPELSLVAGVAVADAIEEALGLSAQIKWPNDVLVNRKKVAGILAEARGDAVVLGIGVNVNQTRDELPIDDDETRSASLFTTDGERRDRAKLLARVLTRLEHHYEVWEEHGLDGLYIDLGSRDFLRGRRVAVDGTHGTAVQIDRAGRLEIAVDGEHGEHTLVESGEVTYER